MFLVSCVGLDVVFVGFVGWVVGMFRYVVLGVGVVFCKGGVELVFVWILGVSVVGYWVDGWVWVLVVGGGGVGICVFWIWLDLCLCGLIF